MTNRLIVESKNDKIFIKKLIQTLNFNNIEIDKPICIDDYECLEGLSKKSVTNSLKSLSASLLKNDIKKIGIIIDQDNCTQQERFEFINNCIDQAAFRKSIDLSDVNNLIEIITDDNIARQLGCYFTNVNGKGELETVLKTIKTQDSDYADCLESWRNCLKEQAKNISDKDFDKFWISNYIRYDTCSPQESKQAGRKCAMSAFDYVLKEKSHIFDFGHSVLDGLKDFLKLFKD
jgi:hypothetical protein